MITLRISPVFFDPTEHRYWLGDKELKGVTSSIVKLAYPSDYDNVPEETLRKAAERGTHIHEVIEDYETRAVFDDIPELASYVNIKEAAGLTHIAAEYLVSDEDTYASQIDHVFTDKDGGIVLADIKTTYARHYDKTALQLSMYKRLFEMQNPGLKVSRLAMIWLRGEMSEYKELDPVDEDYLDSLIEADKGGMPLPPAPMGDLPAMVAAVEREIATVMRVAEDAKKREEELKQGLYDKMMEMGIKSFDGEVVRLTVVLPTESTSLDSKKLKAELPEVFERFKKTTTRKGSLRVTIK